MALTVRFSRNVQKPTTKTTMRPTYAVVVDTHKIWNLSKLGVPTSFEKTLDCGLTKTKTTLLPQPLKVLFVSRRDEPKLSTLSVKRAYSSIYILDTYCSIATPRIMRTSFQVLLTLLTSLVSCNPVYSALECSLCGDMKTVHNDNQQAMFYLSEEEVYTTCVDLAVAVLDRPGGSSECTSIQQHFSSDCCTETTTIRRSLFSSWVPSTASASTWSSGWNQAPNRPASTSSWGNTFQLNTNTRPGTVWSSKPKPTTAWSNKPNPISAWSKPKPSAPWFSPPPPPRPVYRPPPPPLVYAPPPPAPPVYRPNKNVVQSTHPAWGGNNNNVPVSPGTNYANDEMCGICTDPSNPSLGIVVNGFGVGGFSFTGTRHGTYFFFGLLTHYCCFVY